jgi:hypothetical protein
MIEGFVLDMKVYKTLSLKIRRFGRLIGKAGPALLAMDPDFDMDPDEPTKYQAVPDGTSCLLLLLIDRLSRPQPHEDSLAGMVLLQRNSTDDDNNNTGIFERIGYFRVHTLKHLSHLDESGEFTDYSGGTFETLLPVEEQRASPVPLGCLWKRATKRRITLV